MRFPATHDSVPPVPLPLSDDERKHLVENNLEYVRALACEIARRLPPSIDLDDLIAYGRHGLLEAAARFDPTRGASFKTFSYYRIRGAIFDGLRRMSWFGRREHAELRFEAHADDFVAPMADTDAAQRAERAGEAPPEQNIRQVADALQGLSVIFISTLEGFEIPAAHDADAPEPPDLTTQHHLAKALGKLPERECELMRLVYLQDLSLQEAGRKLGLSRSWASRLHARAIGLLREALTAKER